MARSGALLTEAQWQKIAPLLPRSRNSARVVVRGFRIVKCWKVFCGFCAAGRAGRTCQRNFPHLDLLAAVAGLGGAGRLAEHLAGVSERVERTPATEVERIVFGRAVLLREKGGAESEKPSGARGRSGWWWSTARVFLWETHLHSASPAEVKLAETTLAAIRVGRRHHAGPTAAETASG